MKDVCHGCGITFENYEAPYSMLCCSVRCEVYIMDEDSIFCEHEHLEDLCVLCKKKTTKQDILQIVDEAAEEYESWPDWMKEQNNK